MDKAIKAIKSGMAGFFLQSYSADVVRKLVTTSKGLNDDEHSMLTSFLSAAGGDSSDYAPQSGQIVGILKALQDEMNAGYGEASAAEDAAIQRHNSLVSTKKKELSVLNNLIETKLTRSGEISIQLA